jgi:hypothetical protein
LKENAVITGGLVLFAGATIWIFTSILGFNNYNNPAETWTMLLRNLLLLIGGVAVVVGLVTPIETEPSINPVVANSKKFCPFCGAKIAPNAEICLSCGVHRPNQ